MDNLQIQEPFRISFNKNSRTRHSTRSTTSITSVLIDIKFNDLEASFTQKGQQPEPDCCICKSSLGLILYSSFCVIYLLASIYSYFKQKSELLILITLVVSTAIPAVCLGIAGLKLEKPKLIVCGVVAQVIITVWNLVPLGLSVLVIFGLSEQPAFVHDILEILSLPEKHVHHVTRSLLISGFVMLSFVTVKNVWVIKKMLEFRRWCLENEKEEDEIFE